MTTLLVVLTVVEIVILLAALVIYLALIGRTLRATSGLLAKVGFGVRAIETQCEPIGPSVTRINEQLGVIAAAFAGLTRLAGGEPNGAVAPARSKDVHGGA